MRGRPALDRPRPLPCAEDRHPTVDREPLRVLQERKEVGQFRYGMTPAGLHTIKFQPSKWLFQAKLSFWPVRTEADSIGQRAQAVTYPYRGHAEITLNPTRLFAQIAPEVVAGIVPALHSCDLRSWNDRAEVLRGRTLDGSDNVIPDDLIDAAIGLDWQRFCQEYAHRVRECMSSAIGTSYEVGAEEESGPDRFEPLLVLPSPETWSLQQVEHYHEYTTDNAIEAVRRVEPYALSLSREVGVRLYERHVRAETIRQDNARSLSISMGRKGVRLVLYAKMLDRLRVEVRFQEEPAAIAGLRSTEYDRSPNGMADLLRGTSVDAAQRLAQWISEFRREHPTGAPDHSQVRGAHQRSICRVRDRTLTDQDASTAVGARRHHSHGEHRHRSAGPADGQTPPDYPGPS